MIDPLARTITLMIDPAHIWNVIYNLWSNKRRPPTSPNAAPATTNVSHDWSCSHIWNVIYNARTNKSHPNTAPATQNSAPKSKRNLLTTDETSLTLRGLFENDPTMNTSPRTRPSGEVTFRASEMHFALKITTFRAPAIYPDFTKCGACHEKWRSNITKCCACHEKWHSYITKWCACHQKWPSWLIVSYIARSNYSPSNLTKYCACQEKCPSMRGATALTLQPRQILRLPETCLSWLVLLAYETSCTMRRPTRVTQILRLPRKIAPQNLREICWQRMKRHLHCGAYSRTIQPRTRHPAHARQARSLFVLRRCILQWKLQHFALRLSTQISPNAAPATKTLQHHQMLRLPRKVTLQDHQMLRLPRKVTPRHHEMLRLPGKVTPRHQQMLRLPRKVTLLRPWLNCHFTELLLYLSCYWTELLLYWAVTLLSWYCTELLLYWSVTWLNSYLTELLLDWTVTLLSCYVTELLLYWSVIWLNCYYTEVLLDWTVTLLSCYFPELLLYWAVAWLSCCFTELLFDWTVTILSCYRTELLLSWSCYLTELLLSWAFASLNCYFTVRLPFWILCIFKSPWLGSFFPKLPLIISNFCRDSCLLHTDHRPTGFKLPNLQVGCIHTTNELANRLKIHR